MVIEIEWIDGRSQVPAYCREEYVLYENAFVGLDRVGSIQSFETNLSIIYAWANGERIGPIGATKDGRSALLNARDAVERAVRRARADG